VRVLVLGAGVVGTASAWYLRSAGHEVEVLERQPGPALETSFANGGQISVSHAEPWANPSAPMKILRWLGRADAPLLFRPKFDWQQWTWSAAFLRECARDRTAANIRAIVRLALHSRNRVKALRRELALDYDCVERGILHLHTDEEEFRRSRASAALMNQLGCELRTLFAADALALEPALDSTGVRIVGADYCPDDESGDAHAFTCQLAQRAQGRGVRFQFGTTVNRLLVDGRQVRGVEAAGQDGSLALIEADAVVVCLGVSTAALLAPLGLRVRIFPVKGYSATYPVADARRAPIISLADDSHKIVISRFGSRLRAAGTAEVGGWSRELNEIRCEALTRRMRELFPGACDYGAAQYWAGLRPATPSNVPYLGATSVDGLFLNAGHGTLGWTLASGNGALIAELVSGRVPELPLPRLEL
jgi:D-amino-acid dehydrogenase